MNEGRDGAGATETRVVRTEAGLRRERARVGERRVSVVELVSPPWLPHRAWICRQTCMLIASRHGAVGDPSESAFIVRRKLWWTL